MDTYNAISVIAQEFWLGDETAFDGTQLSNSNRPIVVFDSGVGGLTVARQLEQLTPSANILYVADNDWFPYGSKAGSAVAQRVQHLFDQLFAQINPLAIIVACNTASIAIIEYGLDHLKRNYFLVIPPINYAVNVSDNKNIVLLATPGTLESRYVVQEVAKARTRARVWPIAAQALVTLSETKLVGEEVSIYSFAEQIDCCITEEQRLSVDTVILGCTHFPHLINELQRFFPAAYNWIDPSQKIAQKVASLTKIKSEAMSMSFKIVIYTSRCGVVKYHQAFSKDGFGIMPSVESDRILHKSTQSITN
jgi:glutamate racemase